MTHREIQQVLLAALLAVRDEPDRRLPYLGICDCVVEVIGDTYQGDLNPTLDMIRATKDVLVKLSRTWPEASQQREFPVPAPGLDGDPTMAFAIAGDNNAMWDETTEYGAARWRLLHWLIARLEKQLEVGN